MYSIDIKSFLWILIFNNQQINNCTSPSPDQCAFLSAAMSSKPEGVTGRFFHSSLVGGNSLAAKRDIFKRCICHFES